MLSTTKETLLHCNDIIDITLLDHENLIKGVCSIDRVTCPVNVSEIVFLTFINLEIDLQTTRLDVVHCILDDSCIPVTSLIESTEKGFLIILVFLLLELL